MADLARRFTVSAVTIRSDLAALADMGAIVRIHGGALPPGDIDEVPINVKQTLYHAEKVRIAAAAAGLIQDGETVILDSGTTTAEIARQIRGLKLRSINVDHERAQHRRAARERAPRQRHHPGRRPRAKVVVAVGAAGGAGAARPCRPDRLFLGVDSLDPEIGLMTPYVFEAKLNALMIRIARQTVAVTDSSKLLRRNLSVIAPVEQVHLADHGSRGRAGSRRRDPCARRRGTPRLTAASDFGLHLRWTSAGSNRASIAV